MLIKSKNSFNRLLLILFSICMIIILGIISLSIFETINHNKKVDTALSYCKIETFFYKDESYHLTLSKRNEKEYEYYEDIDDSLYNQITNTKWEEKKDAKQQNNAIYSIKFKHKNGRVYFHPIEKVIEISYSESYIIESISAKRYYTCSIEEYDSLYSKLDTYFRNN